jgi:hypothetical protein
MLHGMRTVARLVCLLAGSAFCVQAQAVPAAASVGVGPLVAVRIDTPLDDGRTNVWCIADVDGTRLAQPFWRSASNCDVLARLDRDHLLLASYGDPYALVVVDLTAGTHTILAEGAPHEFAGLHGSDVLHLGDGRVQSLDPFPYATPWRTPERRRRLADFRCERIADVVGNLALLVAEGERSVHATSLVAGTTRRLWEVPGGANHVNLRLSPGGQRLAIGVVAANGKGLLTVVDVATARVVHQWPDLPIDVSRLSSNRPQLVVGWHDDAHVVCSETRPRSFTWVRRQVESGEIVDEHDYGPIGLWHEAPPIPSSDTQKPAPVFRHEATPAGHALLRAGQTEPLRRWPGKLLAHGTLSFAPDGSAVVLHQPEAKPPCLLFTANAPNGRPLVDRTPFAVVWLPAATETDRSQPR